MKLSAGFDALWSNTIGLVALVVAIPIMGHLVRSLRPAKPLLIGCAASAFIIVPWPAAYSLLFTYLASGNVSFAMLVVVQVVFALLISMFSGAGPAAIAEMFPTRSRSTWMTSGYALAPSPSSAASRTYISIWLIERFEKLAHGAQSTI